jgi:hypothetical protein
MGLGGESCKETKGDNMNQKSFSHSTNRLFSVFLLVGLLLLNWGENNISIARALNERMVMPPLEVSTTYLKEALEDAFWLGYDSGRWALPQDQLPSIALTEQRDNFGVVWVGFLDRTTNQLLQIPAYPVPAILVNNEWTLSYPGEPDYEEMLLSLPKALLPSSFYHDYVQSDLTSQAVQSSQNAGYYPWHGSVKVTQDRQNSHDCANFSHCIGGSDEWAWDFGNQTSGWPIYATKGGKIAWINTSWATNSGSKDQIWYNVNVIVIDFGDGYAAIYMHLAQDLPVRFRINDPVSTGELIGYADQTGRSTASHLHFAVQPWNSSWNGSSNPTIWYRHSQESLFNDEIPHGNPGNPTYPNGYTSHIPDNTDRCPSVSGSAGLFDLQNCGGSSIDAGLGLMQLEQNNFNDKAQSIAIPSGWSAKLYLHNSETSPNTCITSTDSNLGDNNFSDGTNVANQTTWIRVYDNSNCRGDTTGQWHAQYFSDPDWSSQRCENDFSGSGVIGADFSEDWGGGAPNCSGMPTDNFSVRYTGTFSVPSTAVYWFHVKHDDSAILWIDNTEFRWPSSGEDCPAQTLTSGRHTFRIDYRENTGSAHIRLDVWDHDCDQRPRPFNKSSPADDATNQSTTLTLNWETSLNATLYEYCYDTSDDNACSSWISTGANTSANLASLSLHTTYYWQVRAINANGTTYANGNSTAYWSFVTGGDPPVFGKTTPVNGSTGQAANLTLSWSASSDATLYEYCYDTTNDNICSPWVSTGTNTSASLSGLSTDTIYYWQVRAGNAFGTTYANGSDTAYWSFKTEIVVCTTLPGAFAKTGPANSATVPAATPTLSWGTSSGASSYEYCIDTTNDNACSSPWVSNGTTTSASPSGLSLNTIYYWQVVAVNNCGQTYADGNTWWSLSTAATTGPRVSTTVDVPSISPGGTAVVSVSLLDVPPTGYASAEFSCELNDKLVEANNFNFTNLFGTDPVTILKTPPSELFVAAIAGSNGSRATTGGEVLTFNLKGLQVGQTTIECTGRVSKGDNFAIPLPSSGSLLKVQSRPDPVGFLRGQVVAAKPVTVKVRTPDNTVIPVPIQPDGTFILPVFPGNYTVDASAIGFLSAETPQGSVTVRDGDTITLPTIRLLAGDIDGNGVINQLDAITIGMNYGTSTPAAADLNNDSVIDFLDLELLARNYLKTGPVAWQENNTNAETLIDPEVE